jgi:hypothetical protein
MSYFDLTTFAAVNNWLEGGASADQSIIQSAITGYSSYILTRTGRRYLGGFQTYTERYDGNGSDLLQLRNYPILAVASVQVGSNIIPQTPDYIQPGWGLDQGGSQAAIVMVGSNVEPQSNWAGQTPWGNNGSPGAWGHYGECAYRFTRGRMNVLVSYTAGTILDAMAEIQTVPPSSPYTVTAINASTFWQDLGAAIASTGATPAYTVTNGVYTFTAAAAGQQVALNYSYGGVPLDLQQAVTEIVATNYKRRSWMDQRSQIQPGIGTTTFQSWEMSPQCKAIICRYERTFPSQ